MRASISSRECEINEINVQTHQMNASKTPNNASRNTKER
jgi:hypothetical protein